MMRNQAWLTLTIVLTAVAIGCQGYNPYATGGVGGPVGSSVTEQIQSPVTALAQDDPAPMMLAGAAVGAGIGAAVDDESGALIGAAIGALSGLVVHSISETVRKRREQFDSEADFLQDETNKTEEAIATQSERNEQLESELQKSETKLAELKARQQRGESVAAEKQQLLASLKATREQNTKTIKSYEEAIKYLEEAIETSPADAGAEAQQKKAELQGKLAALKTEYQVLIDENDRLDDQIRVAERL